MSCKLDGFGRHGGVVGKRLLVWVMVIVSCVSSSVSVANATGGVAPKSLSVALLAVSALPTATTSTTVPTKTVKPIKTTVPVKPKNKNGTSAVSTTVPVIANVSNISTGTSGSSGTSGASGTAVAVVLPVEVPGLISVCVNKSTSVLRDTADNSCSSGSEVKVEWLDSGASPKICVNNNNREMTLAQDGKCATKNSAVADVTVNKQILACADDKTGVLRYRASGVCGVKTDPVVWVLKDQGVARNVDDAVKKGVVEIISLIPTTGGASTSSTKTVTTSPATNTSSATTATVAVNTTAVPTATTTSSSSTTTTTSSTTTTTVASRAVGSFAGYLGGTCPDGSGIPWYWGSDSRARAGGCSAAASIAPTTTAPATTTTAVSATTTTTVAPVIPGTPATPTGVVGDAQVTVSVTAGSGGTPTSYTVSASPQVLGVTRTCTVTGASGSCAVTGLTNSTAYTFTTTATNSAGTSSASTASSSITPVAVPGTPATPTGVSGNTQVTVTVAAGSGGTPTSYTVSASPQVSGVTRTCTVNGASGSCAVTGLTNGTGYTFTTTATNAAGTSSASAASSSVTPAITCATGGTCILGNTGPGGGRVFYVSATNFTSTGSACGTACKYLEYAPTGWIVAATPAGQTNCAAIAGTSSNDPKCQYVPTGALTSTLLWPTTCPPPSCTAMNIGSGHSNTTTWLGQSASAGYAPTVARAYQGGGLTDWHLPSKHELNQMCRDVWGLVLDNTDITCSGMTGTIRVGFLSDGSFYGSSTEYQANGNHALRFSDGIWANNAKSSAGTVVVRPVRAFG
jgi:Fibronectin type III domain